MCRRAIVAVVLGPVVVLGAFAPAAMAGNTGRCRPAFKVGSQYRNYCSAWRGHVPVYERPWDNTTGSQDWAAQRGELIHQVGGALGVAIVGRRYFAQLESHAETTAFRHTTVLIAGVFVAARAVSLVLPRTALSEDELY